GAKAVGIGADVAEPASVEGAAQAIVKQLGEPDILLNNAAAKGQNLDAFFAPVEGYDLAMWREIMAGNLDGMFKNARIFGSRMASRQRGSIIPTASLLRHMAPGQRLYPGSQYMGRTINTPAVYSASKAGVVGLTKYLATYRAQAGVRVNALTPGGVESGQNDEFKRRYSARVPLGRMARADEMVGAAVFLA